MIYSIRSLHRFLETAWSAETSYYPAAWTKERPSYGQCAVTAFVAQDYFGGHVVVGQVKSGKRTFRHYWNLIEGIEVDFTFAQFQQPTERLYIGIASRRKILTGDTLKRYKLLKSRLEDWDV